MFNRVHTFQQNKKKNRNSILKGCNIQFACRYRETIKCACPKKINAIVFYKLATVSLTFLNLFEDNLDVSTFI